MKMQQIIEAHAKRLGVSPERLSEILLNHSVGELLEWVYKKKESDPGSVWYTGDAPDWLMHYLDRA